MLLNSADPPLTYFTVHFNKWKIDNLSHLEKKQQFVLHHTSKINLSGESYKIPTLPMAKYSQRTRI